MITKEGFNDKKEHRWKMHACDQCCCDLEFDIVATNSGLLIGGNLISWGELEVSRREAQKSFLYMEES